MNVNNSDGVNLPNAQPHHLFLLRAQSVIETHQEGAFCFFYNFFFFVNTLETDPQCLSKVKKKMPFPSWDEDEGKDSG